jgi:hypothetical protein
MNKYQMVVKDEYGEMLFCLFVWIRDPLFKVINLHHLFLDEAATVSFVSIDIGTDQNWATADLIAKRGGPVKTITF